MICLNRRPYKKTRKWNYWQSKTFHKVLVDESLTVISSLAIAPRLRLLDDMTYIGIIILRKNV